MTEFCVVIDEFEGQDLKYLLKTFGQRFNFQKIKAYVGKIMINQTYQSLNDQFFIENLYDSCQGITFHPEFKTIKCSDQAEYQLQKFSKNKRFNKYPVELVYTRPLPKLAQTISTCIDLDYVNNENMQNFKIYGEGCEI